MDVRLSDYELLAELDGVPLARFLYESGRRFGQQLGRLHREELTLHSPFALGSAAHFAAPCSDPARCTRRASARSSTRRVTART